MLFSEDFDCSKAAEKSAPGDLPKAQNIKIRVEKVQNIRTFDSYFFF